MGFGKVLQFGGAAVGGYPLSKNVLKSPSYLNKLQNKRLQNAVSTAYFQTDFFREKYDRHGVHPKDIQSVDDLTKLPITTKKELIDNFEATIPKSLKRDKAFLMGTSGSTGQPVQIYKDFTWLSHFAGFCFLVRRIHKMGLPRGALIFDINSSGSIEEVLAGYTKYYPRNLLLLPSTLDMTEIMEKLVEADVQYVASYSGIINELATLKKSGMGKSLKLKKVAASGEILTDVTRQHIESAFGCPCYSAYLSTEAGSIAVECENKKMHVYSDTTLVEIVDDQGVPLPIGEEGKVVLTCLSKGNSTPVLRYNGCADVGQFLPEKCSCGVNTPIMGPIQGRVVDAIRTPTGEVYHAYTLTTIMEKTNRAHSRGRLKQYQIVQHELDTITVSLVRDEEKTRVDDSLQDFIDVVKERLQEKLGPNVKITVKEVQQIPKGTNPGQSTPHVVSKISRERV